MFPKASAPQRNRLIQTTIRGESGKANAEAGATIACMKRSLEESYDDFPRIEEAFWLSLDERLEPRGPDSVYDVIAGLALPPGTSVLDLGCGEGKQSVELAKRFGFS